MVPEHVRLKLRPCCMCAASIAPDSFRDRESYREAHVSGLCQACQDIAFLACGVDDLRAYPVHDGAVVAVRAFTRRVADLVLFPFRFVVPASGPARLVWEARRVVWAGPWVEPIDARHELEPMSQLLRGHQVCLHAYRAFLEPEVTACLDALHLLVGVDECALDAVARVCSLPPALPVASLEDEVPWQAAFGRGLHPIESWCAPEPRPFSTLRTCAVLASLLVETGHDGRRPLEHLLARRRTLFEDLDHA